MATRTVFGRVLLVTGGQEFLTERAVRAAMRGIAAEAPEADVAEVVGSGLGQGELAALTSPSLFSATSGLVLRELEDLPTSCHDELLAFAEAPSPDVACVLAHGGGAKGKALLDRLRKASAVHEVKVVAPRPWEVTSWVVAEVRQAGGSITDEAAGHLVAAVGHDLRALAGAADQLVAAATAGDGTRERLGVDVVRLYFGGRAEVRGFDIADAAVEGRGAEALEQLRWAMANGVASVLVTSAFASGLRALARYGAAREKGLREADLAREVGAPPFRLKILRRQLAGWDSAGLAAAIGAVAHADLAVKGGGGDPDHALEQMVLAVVAHRD